jgi:branched-chain amino acid transport system substrate-binding protein
MKPFVKALALVGVSALALTSAARAEIKIGATVSETGPAAFLGDPEAKTLKMMVEQINAAGGVKGEKIKLTVYDDGGDANKARTFATRLVEEDGVVAIIGGSVTGAAMAVIPVAEEAKVPFIALAGAIEIIDPVRPYVFKTPHTDRMACEKIFEDMKKRGFAKIGMISGTDGFGASMRKQCLDVAAKSGITVVADESYGPKDTDMTPQLTNIRSKSDVQAILNPGFGQGPSIVTRNYAQLGIKTPFYQSHGVASDGFIKLAGAEAAEGVRLPSGALLIAGILPGEDPQKKVVTDYKTMYEKTANEPVSTFGGYAYDAMLILVDAMNRSKSLKGPDIRDAIEGTQKLVATTGVFSFTPKDHLGLDLSAFRMLEIQKGGWTLAK